jgi:hypothetical protein
MRSARFLAACVLAATASFAATDSSFAQSNPAYVRLPGGVNAARFTPDSGPAPFIAFATAHRTGNTIGSDTCVELAKRGFMAICFETRYRNDDIGIQWEKLPLDVKAVVDYARRQPGITRVVLLGHSGGSPMMSLYQAIAEKGKGVCDRPGMYSTCAAENYGTLSPADALVYPDAHPGNPLQSLRSLNPSVTIENGVKKVDPALDLYSPANGYNPNGASTYSPEFIARYYKAQSAKMNELIAKVQGIQARIKAGTYPYNDDDMIFLPGGNAVIAHAAPKLVPDMISTKRPVKVIKNDGSVVTQMFTSVMVPDEDLAALSRSFDGTAVHRLSTFMSSVAIKSTDSLHDIDYCSTINSTTCYVAYSTKPTLFMAMGGYKFIRDHEIMFERSTATDKDFVIVSGALHGYNPCTRCETFPGEFGNSEKNMYDYIAAWTKQRFKN